MSSAGSIRAGRAFVEITAKDRLSDVLKGLGHKVQALGTTMVKAFKVGAAGLAAVTAAAAVSSRTFAKVGDEMQKASLRTGMSVESLSELKHAAEEADVSFQSLQDGVFRAQRTRPGRAFEDLADEVMSAGDAGEQAAKAYEIFGRQGKDLLPLLKQGSAGIKRQREEARKLGLVMSQESAEAAAELSDQFGAIVKQVKAFIFEVGAWIVENTNLIDTLKTISEWLGDLLTFIKSGQLENAWELMWRQMANVMFDVIDKMGRPFIDFLDKVLGTFRGLQTLLENVGVGLVGLFDEEAAAEMLDILEKRRKGFESVGKTLDRMQKRNADRLRELRRQAEELRRAAEDGETPAGAGPAAAAAGAAFGSFDPSAVLRAAIGADPGNPNLRTANATERTAAELVVLNAQVRKAQREGRLAWR